MTSINETLTAKGYTPAAQVPAVFGRARTLDGIVIHHWGAPGQTHEGVVNFFVNGPGTTSAHFVASAGKIHCLVSPLDAAWHSGNPVGNATTIGIECRPEASAADYVTVAELIRWLRDTYGGDLPLSAHREWQATACPGIWDLNKLDQLAGKSGYVTTKGNTVADDTALDVWGYKNKALERDDAYAILRATRDAAVQAKKDSAETLRLVKTLTGTK